LNDLLLEFDWDKFSKGRIFCCSKHMLHGLVRTSLQKYLYALLD
jgi:hypothetical protein